MFDFDYKESVGFVPYSTAMKGNAECTVTEDDLNEISENVAVNSAAIADNAAAIADNKAAINEETSEREDAIDEVNEKIDSIPGFDNVYTKDEADAKFLTEHQDISNLASKDELNAKADKSELAEKANSADVYSKTEADNTFVKKGEEPGDYVTKQEFQDAIAPLAAKTDVEEAENDINMLSGAVDTLNYEFDSVDEKLAGLAGANAEQDEKIAELTAKLKELKEIVGDLGGNVEYAVPGEGKLVDVLKKSGTVKLAEDIESATYTGGITSKNVTTLNTNGKTVTFTGNTVNNPGIMTRGSEQLTVVGKGTINANGRIAIEANGANSVINLSGSTGFFGAEPTYVTDRSGGELIYCYLGTINIYAGIFKNEGENKTFMLNCYDANYRNGTAKIVVMGGKFYDFDPANNKAEGEGTSFVPEGYESVHTTEEIDGVTHDVYTVKKSA